MPISSILFLLLRVVDTGGPWIPGRDQFIRGRHVNGEDISRKEIVLLIFGTRLFVGLFRI